MYEFTIKPKRNKHLCCYPPITHKMDINSPNLIYKFPCKIKLAMKINSSVGSSNHNQCYTVANQTLNAYGKWAGCPGGSGPGYSSTMRYVPYDNGSGLGPSIGGAICNCAYIAPQPPYLPVNIEAPIISGNTIVGSTLTLTSEGIWIGNPSPTLTFQWLRGGTPIINQTSFTYVTQTADVGQQITCRVTGTNSVGSVNAISNVITPILGPPQTITFTGTVNFEIIYVNSLNQVVVTGPVSGGFTIYRVTSTSSGASYVINSNLLSTPISFLIVGGGGTGGGGGGTAPGGGGAGGFIDSSGTTNTATTYSIYVGTGGASSNIGANGEDSLLQLTSGTLTAIGGGRGGNITNLNGSGGGSGGGGAFINFRNFGTGGAGTTGQGTSGAPGFVPFVAANVGGGGGAGAGGSFNGGPGLSSTITGQSIFYAGGGGGLGRTGGSGGGGDGGQGGTDGLGGGGGGNASGGSGVVILRIPSFI